MKTVIASSHRSSSSASLIGRSATLCLTLVILAASSAYGQSASQAPAIDDTATHPIGKTKQIKANPKLDTTSLEKTIREVVREAGEKHDPHADDHAKAEEQLVEYTRQLAVETNRLSEFTRWLVGVTGLMALIAIFQLWMFKRQLNLMEDGARDARNVASAAQCSANAAKASADALMLAERAYVKLSHVTPGLKIKEGKSFCEVEIEIRNHGRTPATVTDVHIWGKLLEHGEPLPVPFQYPPQEQSPSAFLVTQEAFFKTQVLPLLGIQSEEVICSAKRLWVYGHVDYIDVFGRRYQGGYARIHEPWLGDGLKEPNRNNLVYPIDGRYNYDRLREPGEGNDWGEKVTS